MMVGSGWGARAASLFGRLLQNHPHDADDAPCDEGVDEHRIVFPTDLLYHTTWPLAVGFGWARRWNPLAWVGVWLACGMAKAWGRPHRTAPIGNLGFLVHVGAGRGTIAGPSVPI